ncbi:zinc finger protein-like [Tropilaelaps mercedesae]|uniref:Zinc finger protein-like n=1 Tax=Tropilaelaps mercedesae TaxID=418985 RepID=A0A1V9Y3E2_9ACAR|nr:zinc finger protein-like [Tropilaelaps mercedesae]
MEAACSSSSGNAGSGPVGNRHGSAVPDRLTSHGRDDYGDEDYEDYEDVEFHDPPEPQVVSQQHDKPTLGTPAGTRNKLGGGQGGTTRPLILRVVKEVTEGEDGEKSIKQEVVLKPVVPEFETILEYECAEELEEGPTEEEARKEASRISQELLNGLVVYYVRPGGQAGVSSGQESHEGPNRGVTQAGAAGPGLPMSDGPHEPEVLLGQDGLESTGPMSPVGAQQPLPDDDEEGYDKKAKYVCHLCKLHFSAGAEHRYHMRTFHNATAARPCPICSKPFYNTTDLRNHVMAHKGVKPYKCQICGHAFTVKSNLTNHQLRHGPLEYECQICGKRLAQPASLKKHLKSHAGNKPFQCNLCEKRFLQRGDLTRHQLVHNGQRDFTCDLCEKQFSLKANLQTHRRKVHGQDSMLLMQ